MIKILEKLDGDRVMLICEGVSKKEGEVSINLIGNGKKISTLAYIPHFTECFSKRTTTNIILNRDFLKSEVDQFEYIEYA